MLRVASATKAAFDILSRVLALHIVVCSLEEDERGDEHMLLGIQAPELSAHVLVDDQVSAGALVALHVGRDLTHCRLEVLPRVYRKVCQNGTIVFSEYSPAQQINPILFLDSEALEPLIRELDRTIRACFDPKGFQLAVKQFRRSAKEPVQGSTLPESLRASLGPTLEQSVRTRFVRAGDFTRWGLLNAITAEARTAPSSLLLRLERLGGSLSELSPAVGVHPLLESSLADLMRMGWIKAGTGHPMNPPLRRSKKTSAA
ncbi:hypothetical protein [Hyalangium gracile]|uniref:hypothetical protein n=1 Tax=Hyalangium gracile TaxID=394092 RepID=UPI001CCCC5AD|nr:hypothetical protein [Hyalangium gracile]